MSIVITDDKHYQDIADKIRELTNDTSTFMPADMPEGIAEVSNCAFENGQVYGYDIGYEDGYDDGAQGFDYDQGYEDGYDEGHEEGYNNGLAEGVEQGKEAEYDAFWDALQDYGNRTNYQYAFQNWGAEYIEPKYEIVLDNLYGIFNGCSKLKAVPMIKPLGGVGFTNIFAAFKGCIELDAIPFDIVMNTDNTGALNQTFTRCTNLRSLKLVLDGTEYIYSYTFEGCSSLENLIIEGEINSDGFNVIYCPLTHDSLMSIINALKDFSGTTETRTIKMGGKNLPKLTDAEKAIATQKGWTLT